MEQILKYFDQLTERQIHQFSLLGGLFLDWNQKINVISRKDIDQLYERHVLHSLAISKLIQFRPGTTILDIGTGGGFPGIPLAIMFPESNFLLIDSIGKKIKVVEDVSKNLGLINIEAKHQHSSELKLSFDFIVSRAVTAFPEFVKLASGKIRTKNLNSLPNGIIYLKGGDLAEEIKSFKNRIVLHPISDYFTEEFFETKFIVYYPM